MKKEKNHRKTIFFPKTEKENFKIDKSNSLYRTHKKGYSDNKEIIEQLIQSMD